MVSIFANYSSYRIIAIGLFATQRAYFHANASWKFKSGDSKIIATLVGVISVTALFILNKKLINYPFLDFEAIVLALLAGDAAFEYLRCRESRNYNPSRNFGLQVSLATLIGFIAIKQFFNS